MLQSCAGCSDLTELVLLYFLPSVIFLFSGCRSLLFGSLTEESLLLLFLQGSLPEAVNDVILAVYMDGMIKLAHKCILRISAYNHDHCKYYILESF